MGCVVVAFVVAFALVVFAVPFALVVFAPFALVVFAVPFAWTSRELPLTSKSTTHSRTMDDETISAYRQRVVIQID